MAEEEVVVLLFRMCDDTNLGPSEYPSATTIAELKQKLFTSWANELLKDTQMAPEGVDEIKLISTGKVWARSEWLLWILDKLSSCT